MEPIPTPPEPPRAPVELQLHALHRQLERMREMQGRYYDAFNRLIFFAMAVLVALAAASMTATLRGAVLLIPFFVIWVGVQSAYFLTYVVFARVHATGIEKRINDLLGGDVLVAHRIEAEYVFPLGAAQFAGVPLRADQTFIGFLSIHFWLFGAAVIFLSAYRAWQLLPELELEFPPAGFYFPALIAWSLLHLVYLLWYFGTRFYERRIMQVVREAYGTTFDNA